jgi:hypothetical protein
MVATIKMINEYRPRIELGITVQKPELVRVLSRSTGLVEGTIDQTIKELRDHIIEFNRTGRGVKVEGLGTFFPSIDLEGVISISFRPDPAFAHGLNIPGIFTGKINNKENIGKSSDELVEKYKAENGPTQTGA